MKPPRLVGVYAPTMRSGKTALAEWLTANHGHQRTPFAALLKEMCRPLFRDLGYPAHMVDQFETGPKTERVNVGTITTRTLDDMLAPLFDAFGGAAQVPVAGRRGGFARADEIFWSLQCWYEGLIPDDEADGLPTVRHIYQTLGTEWGRERIHPDLWRLAWRAKVESILAAGGSVVADDCRFANEMAAVHELGGAFWWIYRPGTKAQNVHASEGSLDSSAPDWKIINDGTLDDLHDALAAEWGDK